jgi:hypothetical protein
MLFPDHQTDETHKEPTPFVAAFWIALTMLGLPCLTLLMIVVNWRSDFIEWLLK